MSACLDAICIFSQCPCNMPVFRDNMGKPHQKSHHYGFTAAGDNCGSGNYETCKSSALSSLSNHYHWHMNTEDY